MGADLVVDRIWLVTENSTLQDAVCQALDMKGWQVITLSSSSDAQTLALQSLPSLILLDQALKSSDSLTVCAELRYTLPLDSIPILLLLESPYSIDKDRGFQQGVTDYLSQPLHLRELQGRVETWLRLRHLEQQASQQQHQLQRTDQSLRLLLHAVSHDLRNPVLGMQMVFQNLLHGICLGSCEPDDAMISVPRSFVERMVQGSDRHLSLIDALLDTHAEVTRPLCLQYASVVLSQFIPTILCDMKPWLKKNQATVTHAIPTDLPPIVIDPIQICRVLKNLVENALKHNPPGVQIQVTAGQEGDRLWCSVEDNGVGISSEQCEYLFGLFQRGPNVRHTNGLGLGLYLCQQIIRAHGGEINVANGPQGGVRFWFTLPLQPAQGVVSASEGDCSA